MSFLHGEDILLLGVAAIAMDKAIHLNIVQITGHQDIFRVRRLDRHIADLIGRAAVMGEF